MKNAGLGDAERLPPAGNLSRVRRSHRRTCRTVITLDACSLVAWFAAKAANPLPHARSPRVPPAATGETLLDRTSPTDFCYQRESRTHPVNDRPSLELPFPPARRPIPDREQRIPEAETPDRHTRRRLRRSNSLELAFALRQRGQLDLLRAPRRRRHDILASWHRRGCRIRQDPHPAVRANGCRPSEKPGVLSTTRGSAQGATPA